MGFQGYALIVVVVLLCAYVIPELFRRRRVIAETRLDERYAENLRMLQLPQRQDEGDGERGSLFLRTPEVIMDGNDDRAQRERQSGRDVRQLARDRARRRARISQRKANRQRGLFVGAVLATTTILLGIVSALTTLPWVWFVIFAVLTALYGAGVGYLAVQMNKGDRTDREEIAALTKMMKGPRGGTSQSRRPAMPRAGRSAASAASATSSASALSAYTADSVADLEDYDAAAPSADSAEQVAEAGDESGKAHDRAVKNSARVARARRAAQARQARQARQERRQASQPREAGEASRAGQKRSAGQAAQTRGTQPQRSGLSMRMGADIIAAPDFAPISGSSREKADLYARYQSDTGTRGTGSLRAVGTSEAGTRETGARGAGARSASEQRGAGYGHAGSYGGYGSSGSGAASGEQRRQTVAEPGCNYGRKPELPSYTIKPNSALSVSLAGAARSGRLGDPGESGAAANPGTSVQPFGNRAADAPIARRTVAPYRSLSAESAAVAESNAATAPYRPKQPGETFDQRGRVVVDGVFENGEKHARQGLRGGAALDEILRQRRA
ncbi:Uncharacterised protein [Actinobaculum suis]|uniref:Uncharacterized protein n=1 Tax=Actinobaculum suis TaxID=1657 RepID=A0A7Z8YB30_9ACTO|nr:hypothetical protein [Actinobaculum suis]VDG77034.1 Uncharacterised protein [Actinobaculum suis]